MTKLDPDALVAALRASPRAKAAALAAGLGVGQSTISRALNAMRSQVVTLGGSKRRRYALRRSIRAGPRAFPLYRLDSAGNGHHIGELAATYPNATAVSFKQTLAWPTEGDMRDGWYDGLPYWLSDMRPQGFLGRNFARHYARALQVPDDPSDWSDEDVLYALAAVGADQPGDLILGDAAYELFLERARAAEGTLLEDRHLPEHYPRLAEEMLKHGVAGSSAAGEFPKFTAARHIDGRPVHVIVKYSGAGESPAEKRWADLLTAEHLALGCLRDNLKVPAARSRMYRYAGRTFLEVERFDRHGLLGRSGVCSLQSLDAALLGSTETRWPGLAAALRARGFLDSRQLALIERQWWFGRLIGNTDMHQANLSFRPGLEVTEAYDMLPMLYAPLRGGELPATAFELAQPLPREREAWQDAFVAARLFWASCATDQGITEGFRKMARDNAAIMERALDQGLVERLGHAAP